MLSGFVTVLEMADVWKLSDAGSHLVYIYTHAVTLNVDHMLKLIKIIKIQKLNKKLFLFHKSQKMIAGS